MTVEPINYVHRDDRGVAWIADTNIKVIEIAAEQAAYGWEAEEIHAAHPQLSLSQIYAALSHYHDHKRELDEGMHEEIEEYRRRRADASDQVTRETLRRRLEDR